jgi:hypothetical protein
VSTTSLHLNAHTIGKELSQRVADTVYRLISNFGEETTASRVLFKFDHVIRWASDIIGVIAHVGWNRLTDSGSASDAKTRIEVENFPASLTPHVRPTSRAMKSSFG